MTQAGASASRSRARRAPTWGEEAWEDSPLRDVSATPERRVADRSAPVRATAARPAAARPTAARPTAADPAGATRPRALPERAAGGVPGRRTVTITGRGSERYTPSPQRRRPAQRAHERPGFRPDRAGLYAVLLGALLILVAAGSSHAAIRHGLHTLPAAAPVHRAAPTLALAPARLSR